MAKAAYKLPNVFVGCPYSGTFNFAAFKAALDRIPFRWYYADTSLTTKTPSRNSHQLHQGRGLLRLRHFNLEPKRRS